MTSTDFASSRVPVIVGTIGCEGHGKTTLTAAVAVVQASSQGELLAALRAIPRSGIEALGRGPDTRLRRVTYRGGRRFYMQVDVPGRPKDLPGRIAEELPMDVAILVVSAADGPMPQTREHIVRARQLNVPYVVVFLTKTDLVDDPELVDMVELDVRDLLRESGYPGAEVPVIRGSAIRVLQQPGAADPKRSSGVAQLVEALDQYVQPPREPARHRDMVVPFAPFLMPVEQAYRVPDRGTVATGVIRRGAVQDGDVVQLVGYNITKTAAVSRVVQAPPSEWGGPQLGAGRRVGLLLRDVSPDEVEPGTVLATPGSIALRTEFEAEVYVPTALEGGDDAPFFSRGGLEVRFWEPGVIGRCELPGGVREVSPGNNARMRIVLVTPVAIGTGLRFTIRERGRTVAGGVVTVVLPSDPVQVTQQGPGANAPAGRHLLFEADTFSGPTDQPPGVSRAGTRENLAGGGVGDRPPTGGHGKGGSNEPPPLRRHLRVRVPTTARLGGSLTVEVQVALARMPDAPGPLAGFTVSAAGADVLLVLHAPGFVARDATSHRVRVPPYGDSPPAAFELIAQSYGVHNLDIRAYHGGTYLGEVAVEVVVRDNTPDGPPLDRATPVTLQPADAGDYAIEVRYDAGRRSYTYRFIDREYVLREELRSGDLKVPPEQAVARLVRELNRHAQGDASYDAEETRAWLKGVGIELWQGLIPEPLQQLFWDAGDSIRRLRILSEGDPIPWEVMYPFRRDQRRDGGFLAERCCVARWGRPTPAARILHAERPVFVVPEASPESANSEVGRLAAALGRTGGRTSDVIRDFAALRARLDRGAFDVLHFACHNTFDAASPTESSVVFGRTPNHKPFVPRFLSEHEDHFRDDAPLVFLNACRSAGAGPTYSHITGWADSFLATGAGAFVGSLWDVRDESAAEFADTFYRVLLDPVAPNTLGDAMTAARRAIRDRPGDPTWLAYTLYGEPTARIALQ